MASIKKGLLLIQLGTPDTPTVSGVRRYLKLFLSDKRVITLPAFFRYLLLYCIILPIRARNSAKAYQAIWTPEGSPLRTITDKLTQQLQEKLKKTHQVAYGMRYGNPSLNQALESLGACDEITILPLYPQYASSTTGSSVEAVFEYFKNKPFIPALHVLPAFYAHPAFIKAQSLQIAPYLKQPFDHLILSYHGLPVSHIEDIGCKSVCTTACPTPSKGNTRCYRAQCFETTRQLADALKLDQTQYTTAFQSRLGKTPWIAPYTDELLQKLATQGMKHLLIACPAFVTDCLETLEEIQLRGLEDWQALGGETLTLVPCLNTETHWIDAVAKMTVVTR